MKKTGLLVTIVITLAALIAFILLGTAFVSIIEKFPGKRIYYYIPEASLFLKREGNNLYFSGDRAHSDKDRAYYDTDFLIKSGRFTSTLYYPVGEHQYGRIYIRDVNNCLQCLRSGRSIIWLADNTSDSEIPPCIKIELPFKKGVLHYRTIDGLEHQAIRLNKKELDPYKISDHHSIVDMNPFDILPPSSLRGNIEDSHIHIERMLSNNIKLYIRNNYIVCDEVYYDSPDYFPEFYYNPCYPSIIFCNHEHTIISKKCEDIQLIADHYFKSRFMNSNIDNWYIIHLNPFSITLLSR